MTDKRTIALLFVALLVCDAMGSHMNAPPVRSSKGVSVVSQNLRSVNNKHVAIINNGKILAKKGDNGSKKSNNGEADCGCNGSQQTDTAATTTFHNTWEIIGSCSRQWQTITEYQLTVDTIRCQEACVDTITNQQVHWQVLTETKAPQRIIQQHHTHIQVLQPKHISWQTLVPLHVTYDTINCQEITVQKLSCRSACVGELVPKHESQRIIKSQKACARTLERQSVKIQKVKKVREEVSQDINSNAECLGARGGKSIGSMKNKCKSQNSQCKSQSFKSQC